MTTEGWLRRLTPRQRQVVDLVVSGEATTNRHIAQRLGVERETIKTHLEAVYDRLEVDDRLQLTVAYWQHRVADVEYAASRRAQITG